MMETRLLDTDVASFLFKRSRQAERFRSLVEGRRLALSFMSVAELYRWTIARKWGREKIGQLEDRLRRYLIIPYDRDLAWAWARVTARCGEAGRSIGPSDAWIAATALRHDLELVTHNVKDFEVPAQLCALRVLRPDS